MSTPRLFPFLASTYELTLTKNSLRTPSDPSKVFHDVLQEEPEDLSLIVTNAAGSS